VAVPIYIDQYQTQSILIGLGNVPMPRPLTHDLLLAVLKQLQVSVERVEITGLKEGTYYAQLILNQENETLTIDARPSDSIALAVRLKCPIFIAEAVVEEAGSEISTISGENTDLRAAESSEAEETEESDRGATEKQRLEEKLQKAVEEENYEEAANLRDRLRELEKGSS